MQFYEQICSTAGSRASADIVTRFRPVKLGVRIYMQVDSVRNYRANMGAKISQLIDSLARLTIGPLCFLSYSTQLPPSPIAWFL